MFGGMGHRWREWLCDIKQGFIFIFCHKCHDMSHDSAKQTSNIFILSNALFYEIDIPSISALRTLAQKPQSLCFLGGTAVFEALSGSGLACTTAQVFHLIRGICYFWT